jgi:hypothetical protein
VGKARSQIGRSLRSKIVRNSLAILSRRLLSNGRKILDPKPSARIMTVPIRGTLKRLQRAKEMIFATKQLIKSVKEGKLDGIRLEKIGIIDDKC